MNVEKVPTRELFTTEEFKESSWIKERCEAVPFLWICHGTEIPGHFGTYFGCTYARKNHYKNPYMRDLYFLHEIEHASRFAYGTATDFDSWTALTIQNEFKASLASECEVYLRIPRLREKVFTDHPIWFDRFLKEKPTQRHGGMHLAIDLLMQLVEADRREALDACPRSMLEAQIYNYGRQNIDWCRIWSEPVGEGGYGDRPAFRVVEEHMADSDRDEHHLEWLEKVSCVEFGRGNTPFRRQALAFERIYKASGERYGNHILAR